ncbi:hypothetical protein [Glacieibacterium sp.]|uniref:hypothetical protein n=1 Tax=Glacieibacterium sp. TaxID=2860237 RepID=UPI003B002BD6
MSTEIQPRPEVRQAVANLLTRSAAFNALSPDKKREVARATAMVADYLAVPEGIEGNRLAGGVGMPQARALADPPQVPGQTGFTEASAEVDKIGQDEFSADAAREGAKVAGLLLKQVKFPTFVASLIEGVFHAIVKSSIEQMEAYTAMIASVAKSLKQFTDDNVSPNQGRDHMVEKFPDLFEIGQDDMGGSGEPRLKLRDGVDESAALKRVNTMQFEDGNVMKSMDLSDENVETALVMAARMQLAKQRQQLMASMVLMGINRIVITDGRISAKIMYDFTSKDSLSKKRSAQAYDYARNVDGSLATTRTGEGKTDEGGNSNYSRDRSKDTNTTDYSADYYSKGEYKFEDKPVMTAMSAASEASDSQLQTRVQLAGAVEVNFKSDYLPLDKMATPGMIAAIQGNSTPVDPNVVPSARNAPAPVAGTTTPAAAPAPVA